MTRDEIIAEPAGDRLSRWVAVKVMGWKRSGSKETMEARKIQGLTHQAYDSCWLSPQEHLTDLPVFSTDIAAAWEVAEKLCIGITPTNGRGWLAQRRKDGSETWCSEYFWPGAGDSRFPAAYGDTAPLAICRAALLCHLPGRWRAEGRDR